ncbi:hypothetical protein ACIBAC_29045 [Streptomyces sp. NPDC051362]|uniref:hypothetical protein n=1 Tax=Streptomyces sp. NPDC051362 TaxID=3365651 RepID=UPI003793EAFD
MTISDAVVADLISQGLTAEAIRQQCGASYNLTAAVRKRYQLPRVSSARPARTIAEALTLHTETYGRGHLRWTGPTRGRTPVLMAEGQRYNARRLIFRRHYGCEPIGYVRTICLAAGCLAAEHLADDISHTIPIGTENAITYLISKGASDWQIACHTGAAGRTITRLRNQLKDTPHGP